MLLLWFPETSRAFVETQKHPQRKREALALIHWIILNRVPKTSGKDRFPFPLFHKCLCGEPDHLCSPSCHYLTWTYCTCVLEASLFTRGSHSLFSIYTENGPSKCNSLHHPALCSGFTFDWEQISKCLSRATSSYMYSLTASSLIFPHLLCS